MCTLSFVNAGNKIIITSNRDEQVSRPALPPEWYTINNKTLLFPKDPRAGGTWFASDDKGNTAVLLNGAKYRHIIKVNAAYKRSRGLILLDILSNTSPYNYWQEINLDNIEPFTLVLYIKGQLYQLRWDGLLKDTAVLNTAQSYIWSSSTLYSNDIIVKREQLFSGFLHTNKMPDENDLFNFHAKATEDDPENGFIINRGNILKTLSITQNIIQDNTAAMRYHDLSELKDYTLKFVN